VIKAATLLIGLSFMPAIASEWTLDGKAPSQESTSFAKATNVVTLTAKAASTFPPYLPAPQSMSGRLVIDGISIGEQNGSPTEIEILPTALATSLKLLTLSRTDGPGNAGDIVLAPGIAFVSGSNGKVQITSDLNVSGKITGNASELSNYPFYYALQFEHGALSPSDSTAYFIGGVSDLPPTTLQEASRTIFTHASGFIRKVSIHNSVGGNVGSAEPSVFKVVNLTKSTESVITASKEYVNAHQAATYVLTSPLAVDAGDALTIVWETPAWETNPTSVRNNFVVTVER